LGTAFSRDQRAKVYVQDRMREHGPLLWSMERWIGSQVMFPVLSILYRPVHAFNARRVRADARRRPSSG
jgi:hypothetical protein